MSTRFQRRIQQKKRPLPLPSNGHSHEVPLVRKLEADLAHFGDAFNKNSELFSHGLTVSEMHLRVHERVMNDIVAGSVRMMDGSRQIDFQSYMTELIHCSVLAEFASGLLQFHKEHTVRGKTTNVVIAENSDTLVFGGP